MLFRSGLPANANEPPKRLVAWSKVALAAGESRLISMPLDSTLLSIFNEQKDAWELPFGEYKLFVGGSSRSVPLEVSVQSTEWNK